MFSNNATRINKDKATVEESYQEPLAT